MALNTPRTAVPGAMNDPYSGWKRNLAFIWLGTFVGLLGANFVFPFIPFYIEELGIEDKSQISFYTGVTASVTGLSLTLTAPIWGAMADRFGCKPMFLRALIGAGVLVGLMGLVSAVWQLIALRFAMGAFAGTMGAAAALVAGSTPRERVGYSLGLLQTSVFTANMLGPVIGGIVAASLGIRESFIFCAALYLAAGVLGYFFVKEGNAPAPEGMPADKGGHGKGSGSLLANLKVVVAERQIIVMLAFLFCLWLSTTYVRPVLPLSIDGFADEHANADDTVHVQLPGWTPDLREEAATGLVFGVIGLTSTIAALSVGPLGQRLGYRNCVVGAAVCTGILYPLVATAGSFTGFLVFFGAVGLFQGAMVPGTNALIAASTPEGLQGSAFGLAASMQSMALLIGPLAGGTVSGLFGIGLVYVTIGGVLLAAAVGGYLLIREPDAFGTGTPEPAAEPRPA